MKANVYNQKGDSAGTLELPEAIFDVPLNTDLIHQVVLAYQANARPTVAHTKDRSEVRGGGAKPWRQKGTGRARHGSIRSPLWVGGGVTFGPRAEKDYSKKVNKKMKRGALYSALSQKLRDKEIYFLNTLTLSGPKTKDAREVLTAMEGAIDAKNLLKKKNAFLVVIPEHDETILKSFRNFGNVSVEDVRNITALDIASHKYVIFVDASKSVAALENRGASKAGKADKKGEKKEKKEEEKKEEKESKKTTPAKK